MALRTEIFITSRPLYFPCRPHAPYSLSCCPVHLFRTLLLSFPLLSFPIQPFTPPIHITFLSAVRGFITKLNPFLPPGIVCLLPSESFRHTHAAVRPFVPSPHLGLTCCRTCPTCYPVHIHMDCLTLYTSGLPGFYITAAGFHVSLSRGNITEHGNLTRLCPLYVHSRLQACI